MEPSPGRQGRVHLVYRSRQTDSGPARPPRSRHTLGRLPGPGGSLVVDTLEKSVQALCEGRFDLIDDVKNEEEYSDRREVMIEQECLRILALYEPVASDLRRMATVLKVNRDWERIADLALRVARRARKLSRTSAGWPCPSRSSNWLATYWTRFVLLEALDRRDAAAARSVIAGDSAIDSRYRALRKQFKTG